MGRSELRRSYPTEGGAPTDAGRRQQIVVAAWVLGFLAGPLPALVALIVRPGRGTYRRLLVVAVFFWTAVVLLSGVLIATAIAQEAMWPMIGWVALLFVALVATAVAVRVALQRVGPD